MKTPVKHEVESIDITPTWSAILPILTGVLQNSEASVSAHKEAMAELQRMASLADEYVKHAKFHEMPTHLLAPKLGDPDQKES